ncbi:MAG: SAM-dependent methyltransferase [Clostridia bacterium]|nr:SAM-dependent methyltransferase [Clostridia bacterium]
MSADKITEIFSDVIGRRILKKAIFSKAEEKATQKEVAAFAKKSDGTMLLAVERFTRDNKTFRRNLSLDDTAELCRMTLEDYRQVNIITTAGDIEIKRSKSGSVHISGKLMQDAEKTEVSAEGKKYILDTSRDIGFLRELGISDSNGRIHDKKQAKFRQINRFLEIIRDVEDGLPRERPAVIYDLCCGKSYLTFAVYYYFAVLKKREVRMYGVDLKEDVIEYCNEAAKRQNFTHLRFVSGNINDYQPPEPPDMVISLHACDIATDIVLANAIKWQARIILSTPCCHHEMSKQLAVRTENVPMRDELAFILDHPMLKQKFCDCATDALRVKRLESVGYNVTTLELIDPDDTPKNLMIRAVRAVSPSLKKCTAAMREYERISESLGVTPYLDRLIKANETDAAK